MKRPVFLTLIAIALALVAGCHSDAGGGAPAAYHLAPAGSEAVLASYLSAGRSQLTGGSLESAYLRGAPADVVAAADSGGAGSTSGAEFTNLQEPGVEESDLVKTDGQRLYVAEQPDPWVYPLPILVDPAPVPGGTDPGGVIAFATADAVPSEPAPQIARYDLAGAAPASATPLAPLALPGDTSNLTRFELLLSGGDLPKLIALGQSNNWQWTDWFAPTVTASTEQVHLWIFDVADPASVPAPVHVTLEGELVDSRRIGDTLYVVSRYVPASDADPLLPAFTIDDVAHDVAAPSDCLLAPDPANAGYPALTLVTAIDIHDPENSHATCVAGEVDTMYMSPDALYLASTRWDEAVAGGGSGGGVLAELDAPTTVAGGALPAPAVQTLVHRFTLDGGAPHYTGSGLVAGGFTGWAGVGSEPQWRFHERDGNLFLVTSWWTDTGIAHQLHVLAPDANGDLASIAELPNALQPTPIGKPGEDLFAIRYVDDRAYLVTFQQTDPLYVLDLTDPRAPFVAGTLELPGFAAYLHPVGEGQLLGVGRDGTSIVASLFDVRDPAHPALLDQQPLCVDCDAPLLTDYHALAVQADGATTRVAVPVQQWPDWTTSELAWVPSEQASLLAVSGNDIALAGTQSADPAFTALGRVLLVGDGVFQPQVGNVTVGDWPGATP